MEKVVMVSSGLPGVFQPLLRLPRPTQIVLEEMAAEAAQAPGVVAAEQHHPDHCLDYPTQS